MKYTAWRAHLLDRPHRQAEATADPVLRALLEELRAYRPPSAVRSVLPPAGFGGMAVPFEPTSGGATLSFPGTTTVFGPPVDIALSELAMECFYPADDATAAFPRQEV